MTLRSSLAFASIRLVVLSCRDSTAPHPAAGYYVLESVNGQPLPAAILVPIPEDTYNILSGYLALDDDSDNGLTAELRRESLYNDPREIHYTSTFDYLTDGATIELFPHCDETAFCGSIEGVFVGSTIVLTIALSSDQSVTYHYRRAEPPENWSPGL